MDERISVLEVDFINNWVAFVPDWFTGMVMPADKPKRIRCDATIAERFLNGAVAELWHDASKDKMEFFQYFSTGHYFCQRSKKVYDFASETSYWKTYSFKGATNAQAEELYKLMMDYYDVSLEIKELKVRDNIAAIDKEAIYFEDRYMKLRRQKDEMLTLTDWRVLPDIEDKYEGEKDRWIKWRKYIRESICERPDAYENNLAYFKATFEKKFPVDPEVYRAKYDGVTDAPEYMDANDSNQWVGHDSEASKDFMHNRELSIYNMADSYTASRRKVRQAVIDILRLVDAEDVVPVDWSVYYVHDSELE